MKTTVHSPETLLHHLLHRATIFLMATSVIITTACENSDDPVVDPVLSNPISLTLQLTPATAQSGAATRIAIGATTLTAYSHTTTAQEGDTPTLVYRAIVMPGQVFVKNADFIRATTADGTTYTYKLAIKDAADEPTDLTATTNHTYTFALKLNKSTLNLTQSTFSVSSWTSGEPIKGGADMDL